MSAIVCKPLLSPRERDRGVAVLLSCVFRRGDMFHPERWPGHGRGRLKILAEDWTLALPVGLRSHAEREGRPWLTLERD